MRVIMQCTDFKSVKIVVRRGREESMSRDHAGQQQLPAANTR